MEEKLSNIMTTDTASAPAKWTAVGKEKPFGQSIQKYLVLLLFLFASFMPNLNGQTWEWMNPKAGSNFIFDIEYISGSTWIQGGEAGTLFKTTNDGDTWQQVFNPMGERHIEDIFVTATGNIYVLGYGTQEELPNRIIKSTDEGNSWSVIATNNYSWEKIWVFNDLVFVLLVNGGAVQRTTDGGITFSDVILMGAQEHFPDIYFVNDSIGYAAGSFGSISKTTNGGQSWTAVNPNLNVGFLSVWFTDLNTGYFGSNFGRIIKTTDGGVTFIEYSQGNFDTYYDIRFHDTLNGYATGLFGNITRTTNAGVTWIKEHEETSQFYDMYAVAIKSAGTAMAAGAYGNIFTRRNNPNWLQINPLEPNAVSSIDWPTAQKGFATLSSGHMLVTQNGGVSWERVPLREGIYADRVIFANSQQGTVFISWDTLLYTANGGDTWVKRPMPQGAYGVVGAHFPTDQIGYAVGYSGMVLKTVDGGNSWSINFMAPGVNLNDVFFTNADTGFATSYWAGTFRTTNGGNTWTLIPGLEGVALSIDFPTPMTGYSIGAPNYAFKTTDGGFTWNPIAFPFNNNYSIKFTAEDIGYAAGGGGLIYKTTDGGSSWNAERDGLGTSDRTVYDLDIDPSGKLWAVSAFDGIHRKREGLNTPAAVSLQYPVNFQNNTLLILLLRWTPSALADYYQVQISKTADFSGAVIEYTAFVAYHQMLREDLDFNTTYYWRVRGVNLSGTGEYSTVYRFTTYSPPLVYGDIDLNGSVQAYDAGLVLKYSVSAILLSKEQQRNANVTTDEFITPFDASVILQYTVGLITSLPYTGLQTTGAKLIYAGMDELSGGNFCINIGASERSNIYALLTDIKLTVPGYRIDSVIALRHNAIIADKANGGSHTTGIAGVTPLWEVATEPVLKVYITRMQGGVAMPELLIKYRFNEMPEDSLFTGSATDIEKEEIPQKFGITGNYPNPFNPITKINIYLENGAETEIIICDALGTEVYRKRKSLLTAGAHTIEFNAASLPSGIYIAVLNSGPYRSYHKMMLVK